MAGPGVNVVFVVLLGAGAAACGSSGLATAPSVRQRATGGAPAGWRTYVYQLAAVSVPRDWRVVTNYVCPEVTGAGTLFLGVSSDPRVNCPLYGTNRNSVILSSSVPGSSVPDQSQCPGTTTGGLQVEVGPSCTSSNPGAETWWYVPSLGIQARAIATGGTFVGTSTNSVVGRVLHTLRKATASEIIGSSPVDWPTYDYRGVGISVPRSWTVLRNDDCASPSETGTLELGQPIGSGVSNCPMVAGPGSEAMGVTVTTLSPGLGLHSCPSQSINGMSAYRVDCISRDEPVSPIPHPVGPSAWAIPALEIEVSTSAWGPAGSTATEMVDLAVQTLRRA